MYTHIEITQTPFNPETAHETFRKSIGDAGAIVAFTGVVRGDDNVTTLTLSHYPEFTDSQITQIVETASARWPLTAVSIIHRAGEMTPGEPIVFVATASAHRRAAFEAADFLMDYLKSEAPFWKQERRGDVQEWIEPRREDITDKARWND